MYKKKFISRLLVSIFFLTLCIFITGCATFGIRDYIIHYKSKFLDEFNPPNKQWTGIYSGPATIGGHGYARIRLLPETGDCQERPVHELLLPMEKNFDARVTVRFGHSINKSLPVNDRYIGQPVKIISYLLTNENEKSFNKDITAILSNYNWNDYPSVIIIGYKKKDSLQIEKLAYRISARANDFLVRDFSCTGCAGSLGCENKGNHIVGTILTPITVIVDIITLPVQMLAITIALIMAGP